MDGTTEAADVRAGHFWLADNDEHKVSGRLTLDQGAAPRLELDQALTPLLRELEPRDQPEGSRTLVFADDGPEIEFFVVHGAEQPRGVRLVLNRSLGPPSLPFARVF